MYFEVIFHKFKGDPLVSFGSDSFFMDFVPKYHSYYEEQQNILKLAIDSDHCTNGIVFHFMSCGSPLENRDL